MTRHLLLIAGTVFLGLGLLGIVLPVLPTTPFVLLAAGCYARSSERLHRCLLDSRIIGPTIRGWEQSRSIPARAKLTGIGLVVLTFSVTIAFGVEAAAVRWILAFVGAAVIVLLMWIPGAEPQGIPRRRERPTATDSDNGTATQRTDAEGTTGSSRRR